MVFHRNVGVAAISACLAAWSSQAAAILIDNGVTGDGFWQVDVLDGGDSRDGTIDPTGALGPTEVIYDLFTYVDVGINGAAFRLNANTTSPAVLTGPNEVTSSGSFVGPNGDINWTAVSSIAPGSLIYNTNITFTSAQPFGAVRILNYLDEDVLGSGDDVLIEIGTPGTSGFQLLTLDQNEDVGVAHSAGYSSAAGMSYIGWAADQYSELQTLITGAGATYSVPGVVDTASLPPYVDSRYPANNAYGPEDITNAFAFDLDPSATSATVVFALGGSPNAQPPGTSSTTPIPAIGPIGIGALSLLVPLIAWGGTRRRRTSADCAIHNT